MKSKQFGFWTPEKLDELWELMDGEKPMNPKQLAKHFDKPRHVIFIVMEAVRKQKRYATTSYLDANGVTVTVFAAGYANGSEPSKTALTRNK